MSSGVGVIGALNAKKNEDQAGRLTWIIVSVKLHEQDAHARM